MAETEFERKINWRGYLTAEIGIKISFSFRNNLCLGDYKVVLLGH